MISYLKLTAHNCHGLMTEERANFVHQAKRKKNVIAGCLKYLRTLICYLLFYDMLFPTMVVFVSGKFRIVDTECIKQYVINDHSINYTARVCTCSRISTFTVSRFDCL